MGETKKTALSHSCRLPKTFLTKIYDPKFFSHRLAQRWRPARPWSVEAESKAAAARREPWDPNFEAWKHRKWRPTWLGGVVLSKLRKTVTCRGSCLRVPASTPGLRNSAMLWHWLVATLRPRHFTLCSFPGVPAGCWITHTCQLKGLSLVAPTTASRCSGWVLLWSILISTQGTLFFLSPVQQSLTLVSVKRRMNLSGPKLWRSMQILFGYASD